MKKLILTSLVCALCLVNVANSQTKFGLRGGLNFVSTSYKFDGDTETSNYGTRIHFGGFAEIPVNEKFTFQPELLFNQYGGNDDGTKTTLSVISLPLLAKTKASNFSFYAGPQLDFLATAKYKDGSTSEDISEMFSKVVFSGALGADYNLENGVSFGLRYQTTLSDVFTDDWGSDGKGTGRGIMLTVAYKF